MQFRLVLFAIVTFLVTPSLGQISFRRQHRSELITFYRQQMQLLGNQTLASIHHIFQGVLSEPQHPSNSEINLHREVIRLFIKQTRDIPQKVSLHEVDYKGVILKFVEIVDRINKSSEETRSYFDSQFAKHGMSESYEAFQRRYQQFYQGFLNNYVKPYLSCIGEMEEKNLHNWYRSLEAANNDEERMNVFAHFLHNIEYNN